MNKQTQWWVVGLLGLVTCACAGSDTESTGGGIQGDTVSADVVAQEDGQVATDVGNTSADGGAGPSDSGAGGSDTGSSSSDAGGGVSDADPGSSDAIVSVDGGDEPTDAVTSSDGATGGPDASNDAGSADVNNPAPLCCDKGQTCGAGSVCVEGPFNARKCMPLNMLKPGMCWTDGECGADEECQGEMVCGCAAACKAMDAPGKCVKKTSSGAACKTDGSMSKGCSSGEYCKLPAGNFSCVGDGVCAQIPMVCTQEYKPVCGCDKKTYGNACEASGGGTNLSANGACGTPPIPGCCKANADCKTGLCVQPAGSIQGVCKDASNLSKGQCWSDAQCGGGTCKGANICPCGAKCFAPDSPGTCTNAGGGLCKVGDNTTCSKGEYCAGPCGQQGKCAPVPTMCTKEYKPVCGCDKKTYGNACEAAAAGVSVAQAGACGGGVCVVGTSGTCAANEFCAGTCGQNGVCKPKPQMCPMIYKPVCGCDKKTYGNSCSANSAGQEVASDGACSSCCTPAKGCPNPGDKCVKDSSGTGVCKPSSSIGSGQCWNDGDCGSGTCQGAVLCPCGAQCKVPDTPGKCVAPPPPPACIVGNATGCAAGEYCNGTCGAPGVCELKPMICNKIYKPVCGCDKQTYGNACEAASKGVAVAFDGPCP